MKMKFFIPRRIMSCFLSVFMVMTCQCCFSSCTAIDDQIKQLMHENQINGVAIATINHNHIEFCNYGYTSADKKHPINQHTLFDIASISKTFTATLAGVAAAQGRFDLQKPISNYVAALDVNPVYHKINSQELLAHVSGMDFIQKPNFVRTTQGNFIRALAKMQARYAPETHYQYGDVGISLAAIALEKVYHSNFNSILKQQLLTKLNLNETFVVTPLDYHNVATGYNKNNKPVPSYSEGNLMPAGGLKSSTQDLIKYLKLQLNGNEDPTFKKALSLVHTNYYCLYSDGTYQQLAWVYHPIKDLMTPFKPNMKNPNSTPQPLANHCSDAPNGFIEKTGNSNGMSLYILYRPSADSGVVVLTSKADIPDSVTLGRKILKQLSKK